MASSVCCPARLAHCRGALNDHGGSTAGQCAATFPPLRVRPSSARNDLCSPDATQAARTLTRYKRVLEKPFVCTAPVIYCRKPGDLSSGSTSTGERPIHVLLQFGNESTKSNPVVYSMRYVLYYTGQCPFVGLAGGLVADNGYVLWHAMHNHAT